MRREVAGPPGLEPGFSGSAGRRLSRLGHGPCKRRGVEVKSVRLA